MLKSIYYMPCVFFDAPENAPKSERCSIGGVTSETNPPPIFIRGQYQFIQGVNDAANSRVMLSYDFFQFRYLGGEFLVSRERLS